MTEPNADVDAQWPEPAYSLGPQEITHAIGAVATLYANLEWQFEQVFSRYINLEPEAMQVLMGRGVSQELRQTLLLGALRASGHSEDVKQAVEHFVSGFRRYSEIRNIVMHTMHSSHTNDLGILKVDLIKRSKNGQNIYTISLGDVRAICDSIKRFEAYGVAVCHGVDVRYGELRQILPEGTEPQAMPGRPALPNALTPSNARAR